MTIAEVLDQMLFNLEMNGIVSTRQRPLARVILSEALDRAWRHREIDQHREHNPEAQRRPILASC